MFGLPTHVMFLNNQIAMSKSNINPNVNESGGGLLLPRVITMFIFIFIILIVWGWASCSGDDSDLAEDKDYKPNYKIECMMIAKDVVRSHLRSPSTADFPFLDTNALALNDSTYMIKSYVDSQNGFGAMIRSNYVVTIYYYPSKDSYKYERLTIN